MVENPQTLGEHLKKRRVGQNLRQVDVAKVLGANTWTYITWEKHKAEPTGKFVPRIIKWLGYDPFPVGKTFGEKLRWKRKKAGLTRQGLANQLGLNYGSVEQWERDICRPLPENLRELERVVGPIEIAKDGGV